MRSATPTIHFDRSYYEKLMGDFGYDPLAFGHIDFSLGTLSDASLRLRWLCHHEGSVFSRAARSAEKVIVSTGFGLSGVPHAGTLSQILRSIVLQRAGVPVQMVLGDLDAHNGKGTPLSRTRELAEQYREMILALGFRTDGLSCLRTQFDALDVLRTAYLIGHHVDDSAFDACEEDLHAFYSQRGKVDAHMSYRRKLSLNLMTADFVHLGLAHGFTHVLVMLGVDEHKYVRFGRDAIQKMQAAPGAPALDLHLSALYSPLIKGFNNYPKMSKSFPESGITMDMSPETIRDLLLHREGHYTGPDSNVVYQMMASTVLETATVERYREACLAGGQTWTAARSEYADYLIDICSRWTCARGKEN